MNATTATRPKGVTVVGILALVWNLIGVAMCWMQLNMTPEQLAQLTAQQREVYEATPQWLNIVYAVAVAAGVLGAIGLLMRRRWAATLFLISLLAVLVQMIAAYLLTPAWSAYGPVGLVMPVIVVVIALLLWRYANKAAARGALR